MAISNTVYSQQYPNNSKTVTVDIQQRIPLGADGNEVYVLYVYTSAYSNNATSKAVVPIYMYSMKRGWAQGFPIASPVTTAGGTLTVAIDEANSGAVTLIVPSGTINGTTLAQNFEAQLAYTAASGTKAAASNALSYLNARVEFQDGSLTFLSGSVNNSYNDSDMTQTTSVQVTGGTLVSQLGFSTGYPNSFAIATTTSGSLHGPASANVTMDDAVRWAIASIVNQIDFSS